jgi:hypothetical protein
LIALPRPLAPWASQLALFPEDIALVIGPMVARLAAVIGGAPFDEAPEGLPDGFDGIATRGSYDRLLAGEWLLLEELPNEFLRRAVSGEHLFLQRAYQADSAAKQTVALFDAGPNQLGAPRLAQLAVLIALAKRAGDSGATLKWGILQDGSTALQTGVTRDLIRKLLRARCAEPVHAADVRLWMAVPEVSSSSEIWFVGAEAAMKEAQDHSASALIISDVLQPRVTQRIHIRAVPAGRARAREALLDAPAGPAGVRILRDPFGVDVGRRAAAVRVDVRSNIVFSADGRKLFVSGESRTLITVPVPNSPRANIARPQRYSPPAGHSIMAVGQTASKKRTIAVTQGEGELAVHTLSKRGGVARKSEAYIALHDWPNIPNDASLRPLGVIKSKYCFIDAGGNLIELNGKKEAVKHTLIAAASRAAVNAFVYVIRGEDRPLLMIARLDEAGEREFERAPGELPPMPKDSQYYFSAFGLCNLAAYSHQESRCVLVHNLKVTAIEVPRSLQIAGVVHGGEAAPMLIGLHEERMRVEGLRNGNREVLFSTVAPIAHLAVSDAGLVTAYITEAGEIGIYSCAHNTMLLQVAAGGIDEPNPA